ncbi:MAG: tRNA lysidine(34) synthetase TilS [Acidobacteriota bacterium]
MPTTGAVITVRAAVQPHVRAGPIGVACSGGADSMCLADAAIGLGGDVTVITIDHGLSAASATTAGEVRAWARGQGAKAIVTRVDVARTGSLEAAAREARYAALAATGLPTILLGHTARDQAETVLMRIVRGTGPAGLAGIPAARAQFVRPLLALPRDVIDAYVAERGLPTWDDPMNADASIARVRFRERLLPALRAENPALDDALVRLAASAREWLDVIDALAEPHARLPIDCPALARQPPAIRKRALALALERVDLSYDAVHLEALDEVVTAPARGEISIDVPGAKLVRSYDTLNLPSTSASTRTSTIPDGYELRVWQPGDRMCPARLKGRSRKLSDLYIDAKIPREARRAAKVLVRTTDHTIVWAEHLGYAFGVDEPLRSGGNF